MNIQSGSRKKLTSRQSKTNRRRQTRLSIVSNSNEQSDNRYNSYYSNNDPQEKGSKLRIERRPPNPLTSFLLYALRLGVFGVGVSVIAGSVLSSINFNQPPLASLKKTLEAKQENTTKASAPKKLELSKSANPLGSQATSLELKEKINPLETKLQQLIVKNPKIEPGIFFVDLDNNNYVDLKGTNVFSAASTIKIPVLVAFFQDVDAGKIRLDEKLTITQDVIGSGSGDLQYKKVGTQITALETAYKMIVISDNTATNMLIKKVGGKEVINQRLQSWGLTNTVINNPLPDLEGTNTTSPKELTTILAMVNQGQLISLKSRDRMLGIMQDTQTRTLLPQGIEKEAIISHKTGDIGTVLGDAGIIDMPNGKRYIGAVLAKRPFNDPAARTLIQDISRTVYQHLKATSAPIINKTSPAPANEMPKKPTNSHEIKEVKEKKTEV